VLDRGPGVPDALKKSIFEKYSTLQPKSLSSDGGTGLGLTFCRLAAQALGGRIWAEDRPGGGSAFVLLLPTAS
jgi:signal transduction histidine kinase